MEAEKAMNIFEKGLKQIENEEEEEIK